MSVPKNHPETSTQSDLGIYVGSDVIHVMNCGTGSAVAAIAADLRTLESDLRSGRLASPIGYVRPPFGCNCERVIGTQDDGR